MQLSIAVDTRHRGSPRRIGLVALALILSSVCHAGPSDLEIAVDLAEMLRAGRSVISAHQSLINDPAIGDKGFSGEALVHEAEAIYQERVGSSERSGSDSERDKRLLDAQKLAMRQVVDAHQADINVEGVGFKGFIPAVFARLSNDAFKTLAGSEARIRVTAPPDLVRNRKARPDPWEREILSTKLQTAEWPKGEPYTDVVEYEGRPAFRMLLPEYYRESCLSCHGGPKGETDVTGYPKEGGAVGDLGGAISIVIFQ
jgi:hypothetical protein